MRVIAYSYEADIHCPDCAYKRFMHTDDCKGKPDENAIDDAAVDSEGNTVHPVFDIETEGENVNCGDCNAIIYQEPNSNCLEGVACPKCKANSRFKIAANVIVEVTDDGTEDQGGDYEWSQNAYCECCACGHTGQLWEFSAGNTPEPKKRVVIEVTGGVAYVASAPDGIEVIIKDYDDQESENGYQAERVKL